MTAKVLEADAGVHTLGMAVAVSDSNSVDREDAHAEHRAYSPSQAGYSMVHSRHHRMIRSISRVARLHLHRAIHELAEC